jgi:oligopeptide transport system ATP-binding protein
MTVPILQVEGLEQRFRTPAGTLHAVNGVSFSIAEGEAVGLVGESGSGKSTVAKCLVRLQEPAEGRIYLRGAEITHLAEGELRPLRKRMQMVFQDPTMSLNPRFSVRRTLSEPLQVHHMVERSGLRERILHLMDMVNLDHGLIDRRPHELSGGQKQRVGIARAIATRPDFVIFDEPTSSLDMSIRVQIVALIRRLQAELGMAYLFISHDLSTIRSLCSRVLVMYLGQIVEEGPAEQIFTDPKHPYTKALLSALPVPDPARRGQRVRIVLPGETPAAMAPITGCPLADRCQYVEPSHRTGRIPVVDIGPGGHRVACLLYGSGAAESPPATPVRAETAVG